MTNRDYFVIELLVNNHAGVMSHINGLFARRAFNLEGILCGKIGDGTMSKMYLLVNNDDFLVQIVKQLSKLYDVKDVRVHDEYDISAFSDIQGLLKIKSQ
jgi:acetolactate synthase-1/3 small subunit